MDHNRKNRYQTEVFSQIIEGEVTEYDADKYGRTVGVVNVGGVNVNEEIIRTGYQVHLK